jgi:hypothetical protein
MVASMTEEQGDFFMTQDRDGWYRVGTTGTLWFDKTGERAVVDYRAPEPGKLQIQWARQGDWFTSTGSNESEPVAHRLTYEMRYAVAEVTRASMAHMCGILQDFEDNSEVLRILAVDEAPFAAAQEDAHLSDISPWLDAILADRHSDRRQGVSAIVRGAMTGWAFGSDRLRLLDNDEFPLGEEDASCTIRAERFPFMSYPFYAGMKADQTGCYTPAAVGFVFVGLLSIATAALRIWVGPSELTSWTAQHVYLSQIGALNMMYKQDALATGYQPAPAELGRLRLHSRPSIGQSEGSAYTHGRAWSFESTSVRFNDLPQAKEVSRHWHKELG